jgi:hypothetical protein
MVRKARKPNWDRVIAGLRRGVVAGNALAMTELAITINDGIRDANGRTLVRRNSPYAFRLLRRAVESGDENAALPVAGAVFLASFGMIAMRAWRLRRWRVGIGPFCHQCSGMVEEEIHRYRLRHRCLSCNQRRYL